MICINSIPKDVLTVVFMSSTGLTKREWLSKTFSTSCFDLIVDVSPIKKEKTKYAKKLKEKKIENNTNRKTSALKKSSKKYIYNALLINHFAG